MSAPLPDFTTAPAWVDRYGDVSVGEYLASVVTMGERDNVTRKQVQAAAPWKPLRAATEWVARVDEEQLAHTIALGALGRPVHSLATDRAVARAVLDHLRTAS